MEITVLINSIWIFIVLLPQVKLFYAIVTYFLLFCGKSYLIHSLFWHLRSSFQKYEDVFCSATMQMLML